MLSRVWASLFSGRWAFVGAIVLIGLAGCSTDDSGHVDSPGDTLADIVPPVEASVFFDSAQPADTPPGGGPDVLATDCEADPGGFLCPCIDNNECNSGFCIPTRDGKACTQYCTDECPVGWDCSIIQFPGADPTFLCLDPGLNLCRPCTSDAQCQSGPLGNLADRCIQGEGRGGSFCGVACSDTRACVDGYTCETVTTLEDGATVKQCVPADDAPCSCSLQAVDEAAWTACNDQACEGVRTCTADGLSECDAAVWTEEICDGGDNDCDDLVDEGFGDLDADGLADCVDDDDDNDTIPDSTDNCPRTANTDQLDTDSDSLGDVCDDDDDNDTIPDSTDNCPLIANSDQTDTDEDGVGDACDATAPDAPTLDSTAPTSPAADPTPEVRGQAERGATVTFYGTSDCTGTPLGTAVTADDGAFAGDATVAANTTTQLYGTATDGGGNVSACSDEPLIYVHDDTAPTVPVLTTTEPPSPSATDTEPQVSGTADAGEGLTVRLYTGAACEGEPTASSAVEAGTFTLDGAAAANATTPFVADVVDAAGNVSGCSEPLLYTHDDIAPPVPTWAGSDPPSPSNTTTEPTLSGYAEGNATVTVFLDSNCTDHAIATTQAPGGSFAVQVEAAMNATTPFYANATDAAGNTSDCSEALPYTHDVSVPDAPMIADSDPASPSPSALTPELNGTASPGTIRIYAQPDCAGDVMTTTAAAAGAFAATVTAQPNTTTNFSADLVDDAGNTSACSEPFAYLHDDVAPPAPVLTATDPTSPSASELPPTVFGSAEANTRITLYGKSACGGPALGQTDAGEAGAFGLVGAAVANDGTSFSATATDAAGNISPCSEPLVYIQDATAPDAPVLTGTDPASPSATITEPTVLGTTEGGAAIEVYNQTDCVGDIAATGSASDAGAIAIAAPAGANTTTTFSAIAIDTAGNRSACSGPVLYVHDSEGPTAPTITGASPPSPSAQSVSPLLTGTTAADTTVQLFADSPCSSATLADATVAGASFTVTASLPANSTRTFYARAKDAAGNVSPCSAGFDYTHDNIAPAKPRLLKTTPASPTSQTTAPYVDGTAEAGTTLLFYASSSCDGAPTATLANNPGAFSVQVTAMANAQTTYTATATDAVGNVSACSDPLSYLHDADGPGAPVLTEFTPASPSRVSTSPAVNGTTEAGTTVQVYGGDACAGTPIAAAASSPAAFAIPLTLAANDTSTVTANATDAAGNVSSCSNAIAYTHDDVAPTAPVILNSAPVSPSNSNTTPTLSGTAELGATVRLFTNTTCTSDVAATATRDAGAFDATVVALTNGTRTFYATATDAAGNESPCSAGFAYAHDSGRPPAPVWVGSNPASPSNASTSPTVSGAAEDAAQVSIFASEDCSGAAVASVAATGATFAAAVSASSNATVGFTANATDAAGNVSDCSAALSYTHDSAPPAPPTLTSTTPASPSNTNTNPVVNGTAESLSAVELFINATCSGTAIAVPATASAGAGAFGIGASVTANTSTTFYAVATDAAGNRSACSAGLGYVHDNLGSGTPVITSSDPASPNNTSTTPTLRGTAEGGVTVEIFTQTNCGGAVNSSGPATGGSFAIVATAANNAETLFYAQAIDAASNRSRCSSAFPYRHDVTKPAPPNLVATTPPSPARSTSPTVTGTAEALTTVRLYTNASCSAANAGPANVSNAGAFSVTATVGANATTPFYATATDAAGNVSSCSSGLVYVSDNSGPTAPVWTGSTPTSPSNSSTTPALNGTAEQGAVVRIYASATCAGAAAATTSVLSATTFSGAVTVGANTTTTWTATATDAAGNTSACSAPLTYTHDNMKPTSPSLSGTSPASPSRLSTTPSVLGNVSENGLSVQLFYNANCSDAPTTTRDDAALSWSIQATVATNSQTDFSAKARDAAGNLSGCSNSVRYIHDGQAPATPSITASEPASPNRVSTTPDLSGSAETGATVRIYTTSNCAGTLAGSVVAIGGRFSGVTVNATANSTTTFYASATDAAGNASGCSAGFAYVHDSVGPNKPVLTGTTPTSPNNSSVSPSIQGTVNASGLLVRLYKTANCTGVVAGQASNAPLSFSINASVGGNTTTAFSALAIDAAGNPSACSNTLSYTHDNLTPSKPVITGTNPTSPSRTSTTPQVQGTTSEAGLTVRLYTSASCLSTPIASGTATTQGAGGSFAISAPAASNTTTTFYAKAFDAAGNNSGCSNGFPYVHDIAAPPTPVLTTFTPTTPSTTTANTKANGTEGDPTARVFVYPSSNCTGTAENPAGTVATASVFSVPFAAGDLSCTAVSANAVDPAGNTSGCSNSLTFAHYGCAQCLCSSSDWLRQFGTTGKDWGSAVVVDHNNNSIMAGTTYGGVLGQSAVGDADAYLVKRSSTGNLVWARQIGTSAYDSAASVAVDSFGNAYVAGSTTGDIDGSGRPIPPCSTTGVGICGDAWVAKYSAAGTRLWISRYSSDRRDNPTDIAWDSKNSRLILSINSGTSSYGSGQSPQIMAVNASTGTISQVWAYINDSQNKSPSGLAVDSAGNIYVQGRSQWSVPGALSTNGTGGNGVIYLYKISEAGDTIWAQHWGSPGHDIAYDMTIDSNGDVYAVGFLQGAPEGTGAVGGPYRGAAGTNWSGWGDAALARFNSAGAQQWVRIFGTSKNDLANSVWLYGGQVHVSGASAGHVGTGSATSQYGGNDMFVAVFNTDGSVPPSNVRMFGTAGNDSVGRSALVDGVWLLPGTASADWTGMSQDACTYQGNNDAFLGRFCLSSGLPVE
ncbi:MAG: hypothetical protein ACI9MR_001635 [Myxococcota bacterium]|jgi:hypothetical protein